MTLKRLALWVLLFIAVLSVFAGAFNGVAVWHVATQTDAPAGVALFEAAVAWFFTSLFFFAWGLAACCILGVGLFVCSVAFFAITSGNKGKGNAGNETDVVDPDAPRLPPKDTL